MSRVSQQQQVEAGLRLAGSNTVILALRKPLEIEVARELLSRGRVAGIIDPLQPSELSAEFPTRVGRWKDPERSEWEFPQVSASTVLFLGPLREIGARMLLAAMHQGIRHLIFLSSAPLVFRRSPILPVLGYRLLVALFRLIIRKTVEVLILLARPARAPNLPRRTHSEAFRELREYASHLSLPKEAFNRRRVLLTTGSLQPGGAERQFSYTACGLAAESEFDVRVHVTHLEPPLDFFKNYVERSGLKVQLLDCASPAPEPMETLLQRFVETAPPDFESIARETLAYVRLFRSERPALVHTWLDACNIAAGVAAQIVGVPALICSCRSGAPTNFAFHKPYMKPGYESLLANGPVLLLNNSCAGARDYSNWLGQSTERFRIIHNGFEFPDLHERLEAAKAMRSALNIPSDALVIGSILRFSEEKRPTLLVDVALKVLRARPDVRCVFFGQGDQWEECRARVETAGQSHRVLLPGHTDEAWTALGLMDIFVLTSRIEGLPNVVVEAQAMGVPVIATDVGGVREAILDGQTGWAIQDDSVSAIADACITLLDDPKRRSTAGERGAEFARSEFSLQRMLDETIAVYKAAIYGNSRMPGSDRNLPALSLPIHT